MIIKKVERLKPNKDNNYAKLDKSITTMPGVYLLFDKNLELLYIGKAKNIRNRILQHTMDKNNRLSEDNKYYSGSIVSYLEADEIYYYSAIEIKSERERNVSEAILINLLNPVYNFLTKSEILKLRFIRKNNKGFPKG